MLVISSRGFTAEVVVTQQFSTRLAVSEPSGENDADFNDADYSALSMILSGTVRVNNLNKLDALVLGLRGEFCAALS